MHDDFIEDKSIMQKKEKKSFNKMVDFMLCKLPLNLKKIFDLSTEEETCWSK